MREKEQRRVMEREQRRHHHCRSPWIRDASAEIELLEPF
jgi:hypothetical protein